MARKISTIKEAIRVEKNSGTVLDNILFAEEGGSRVGVLNNVADVVSVAINVHEQIFDELKKEVNQIAANAIPSTENWLNQKVKEFQYSAEIPQFIQFIDNVPKYEIVDTTLRIITRSSVLSVGNGRVTVKAGKSEPPVKLAAGELTALQQYVSDIFGAGPFIVVISRDADKIYIDADIYYNGQFVDSIQDSVKLALTNYLNTLPFDGVILISKLQDAIQGVEGVNDVVINEVRARGDNTIFSNASIVTRQWTTLSGYAIEEDESGNTWNDTLNFIVE